MAPYNYSVRINEHRARAVGLLLPISIKQSIEICKFIRGRKVQKVIGMLNDVIDMRKPIPYTRFTEGAGHKHGIGPGKYPVKTCKEILKLVKLVEANAQHKGLNTSDLEIIHICAKKGPKSWHYGRQSRIAMKRTHVEIVVEEKETKKKEVKEEPVRKKELKKQEEKPKETKKPAEKVEKKPKLKKEQPKEIKKPAEAKAEKKDEPKKEQSKEKVPTAAELAEKTKKKENKADKK